MGYIQGEGRSQGTLFPVVLDDFVPADHMCRVIDAFVETLVRSELGFEHGRALRGVADRVLAVLIATLKTGKNYDPNRRSVADVTAI
jgi:hypothetical protein